jgi:hypothetical protein
MSVVKKPPPPIFKSRRDETNTTDSNRNFLPLRRSPSDKDRKDRREGRKQIACGHISFCDRFRLKSQRKKFEVRGSKFEVLCVLAADL